MNYNEVYGIAMPESKRKEERWNLWVKVAVRPLSILFTVPLTRTNIEPTTVTKWSILSIFIGFFLVSFGISMNVKLIGWLFFFVWAVLDGVDGNLARCTGRCSHLGDLWDTMGGYISMVLIYFSSGIASFYDVNIYSLADNYLYLIIGGASSIMSIFPRLIMHKKKSSYKDSKSVNELSATQDYSLSKIAAMNLVSPSGFMQVLFLLAILFHILNIFTICYFFINLGIMILSLNKLLREEK